MTTKPQFAKDNYFKIDVECHLSGDIKKYIDYYPAYKKWWIGTDATGAAFGARKQPAAEHEAPKAHKAAEAEVWEPDKLIGYMDRFGVDMACVLPESMMDTTGFTTKWSTNGYLAAACEKYPDRFILQANVGPFIQRGMKNVLWELDYLVKERNCKLVKFYPPEDTYINDERIWPFYERCQQLGIPVTIHTGFSWCPPGKSKYCLPVQLDDVANDFWDLKIIAFHAGYPYCHDLNMVALTHPNVYISYSLILAWAQNAPKRLAEIVGESIQYAGEDRIVWGTDFFGGGGTIALGVNAWRNFHMPEDLQKDYGYAPVTDEIKAKVFGGNLAKLLNVDTRRRVK
jgi:uncharacterized protein